MANIFDLFDKIKKETPVATPVTHIVVGLGNPGDKYLTTRHNAGFCAIDYIAAKLGVKVDRLKFKALVTDVSIDGVRVLLMKPQTFMNSSGEAISEAASFYKIPPENITVICDDINFDTGVMRIRRKGSDGGHNGLKSIILGLSSDAFPRIKLGVGVKPSREYPLVDWVLGNFGKEDKEKLFSAFESVYDSVCLITHGKIDDAMCKYSK